MCFISNYDNYCLFMLIMQENIIFRDSSGASKLPDSKI